MRKRIFRSLITGLAIACGLFLSSCRTSAQCGPNSAQPCGIPATNLKKDLGEPDWARISATAKSLLKYDSISSFSEENLARVRIGDMETGKWGFIDKTGKEIISPKYFVVDSFMDGLAAFLIGDWQTSKFGFIDKTGKEIISPKYDWVLPFSEGLAEVNIKGKWGFINRTGKEVIPLKYDEIWCHAFRQEGFLGVVLNGRKGFVDIYGKEYFDF
jgi:hypothetical protein